MSDERDYSWDATEPDADAELHDCGYVEGTFACKIRHIYVDRACFKGDH